MSPTGTGDIPAQLRSHPTLDVQRLLGRGGMGAVYLAQHRLLGKPVAVKVVGRDLLADAEAGGRFAREIKAAARLDHPFIVRALNAESVGDLQLLVMEYVPGRSLEALLAEKGRLPVAYACQLVRMAAQGLQHAHEAGLVHRDIKPGNLMLSDQGRVKILDFGLAKHASERQAGRGLTERGMAIGTPEYIAPEQALDTANADIRADIYALGGTLYALLTGEPPYRGATDIATILMHQSEPVPDAADKRPGLPAGLADLVRRLMAKAPADRPATPKEVAALLDPFCKARPGEAKAGETKPEPLPQAATRPAGATTHAAEPLAGLAAPPPPRPPRRGLPPVALKVAGFALLGLLTGVGTWFALAPAPKPPVVAAAPADGPAEPEPPRPEPTPAVPRDGAPPKNDTSPAGPPAAEAPPTVPPKPDEATTPPAKSQPSWPGRGKPGSGPPGGTPAASQPPPPSPQQPPAAKAGPRMIFWTDALKPVTLWKGRGRDKLKGDANFGAWVDVTFQVVKRNGRLFSGKYSFGKDSHDYLGEIEANSVVIRNIIPRSPPNKFQQAYRGTVKDGEMVLTIEGIGGAGRPRVGEATVRLQ